MTTYLTFTDRDSYLTARAAWRADYAELSAKIRSLKNDIRDIQRENGSGSASRQQENREYARRTARSMMATRQTMKEQSAEQRAARLAEKETA